MGTSNCFDCEIPDPGTGTSVERTGRFREGTQRTRAASCRLENGRLVVSCRHVYGGHAIDLLAVCPKESREVAYFAVSRGMGVGGLLQREVVGAATIGAGMGASGAIIAGVKIAEDPGPRGFSFLPFLGVAIVFTAVFGGIGALVGAIRAAARARTVEPKESLVAFEITKGDDCLLSFRVPVGAFESVSRCMTEGGFLLKDRETNIFFWGRNPG